MQKFSEFNEAKEQAKGTYSGGTFSDKFNKEIISYIKTNNIPNKNKDIHATILFSRKNLPNYKAPGKVNYKATPKEFKIFEGDTKVLVVILESSDLVKRHNDLMKEHKAAYDFPEYIPHITLSYDIEDFDIDELKIETLKDLDFTVTEEYYEELNLDWKNSEEK